MLIDTYFCVQIQLFFVLFFLTIYYPSEPILRPQKLSLYLVCAKSVFALLLCAKDRKCVFPFFFMPLSTKVAQKMVKKVEQKNKQCIQKEETVKW